MGETRSETKHSHTSVTGTKVEVTKISNGQETVKGYGSTPEKSQTAASNKWEKKQS